MQDVQAELLFGISEVYVPAVYLADGLHARILDRVRVQYFHLLMPRHEVIFANDVPSESLFQGDLVGQSGRMLRQFFPDPPQLAETAHTLARPTLRRHEANLLVSRCSLIESENMLRHSA